MAMFVSSASEYTVVDPSKPITDRRTNCRWWHARLLSDSHILSSKNDEQRVKIPMPEEPPKVERYGQRRHRKAASVNDADTRLRASRWLGSLVSPASPVLPTYPPPVRLPTPPGLPSFGTEEAVRYSARFPVHVHPAPTNGQSQQSSPRSSSAGGNRVDSYGEAFRRFFGISSSSPFRPTRRGCTGLRATDGIAIQGRFPHRHSAHGVGAGSRLAEHPFHRRNLSMAQCGNVDENSSASLRTRPLNTEQYPSMKRQSSIRPAADHSRPQSLSSNLPPRPNYSVIRQPQTPSPHPVDRCESHLTWVSQQEGATTTPIVGMSAILDSEPPGCAITQTRSTPEPSIHEGSVVFEDRHGLWLQASRIVNFCFCCCLGAVNEQDTVLSSNTASNETYTTARSRASNDSTVQHPHVNSNKKGPVQELGHCCSNIWTSFRAFLSSHSYGPSTWLDQSQEPF
ncbi:hypothetical protein BDV28DRAFT_155090 [Aspergillus coremiiformis]|uniref:Uncharacterized protein n=1 Tax=Aspergillus coremiiformis TaxID=138285 RepID=A0A5N6ZDV0_9EURO|nr:hypothetical protein BDV28DRAFT_155090 [Aspergillus coremiiformis]